MHIHFTNDFALRLSFYNSLGRPVEVPPGHASVTLSTASMGPEYSVRIGDTGAASLDCSGSRLIVSADGHGLAPGDLKVTVALEVPDDTYPDGFRLHTVDIATGITLSRSHACFLAPAFFDIPVYLPDNIAGKDAGDSPFDDMTASKSEVLDAVDDAFRDVFS